MKIISILVNYNSAYLFEEPSNLIKQECRDPSQYNSIIKAIATGFSRMSGICSKTGLDTGLTTSYLKKLMTIGIVKKEMPFGTDNSRKTIYSLEDSRFRFWYRFIRDNLGTINRGLTDLVYNKNCSSNNRLYEAWRFYGRKIHLDL